MEERGWFSNILGQITKTLSSFIAIFKKHGVLYSIIMMILFIVFYSAIINPIKIGDIIERKIAAEYQKQKVDEQAEYQKSIEKRLKANNIISDIMQKIVDKYEDVHRVLMLEAHNTVQSINGVDFLYYSCTYECLTNNSRNFNYLSDDLQRQMVISLIGNNMFNTLKHRDYIFYDDIKNCQHSDHRLIHKLALYDDESIIIPFLNSKEQPVILLVISGNNLNVEDIINYINDFKKQIEDCLM